MLHEIISGHIELYKVPECICCGICTSMVGRANEDGSHKPRLRVSRLMERGDSVMKTSLDIISCQMSLWLHSLSQLAVAGCWHIAVL